MVGTWDLWHTNTPSLSRSSQTLLDSGAYYTRFAENSSDNSDHTDAVVELPFRDIHSNNMALRREDYFKVGMMQPLEFSGSSMWCDLEFTYRAIVKASNSFEASRLFVGTGITRRKVWMV